ncbi:putative RNA-directed DNA polymerase [Helianthus annuus]|nr:putative RNA-directed DNA polymerase [Helianthus annuus]KAJ0852751.1 putative RNA-directed DNA polymerase [Helianthus annuus]
MTIATIISSLNHDIAIKDLGDLNYFLGLGVAYTNEGLFLHQSKYATDILRRVVLLESKPLIILKSVKWILRYVKGTLSFGLMFSRHHQPSLVGFFDADWARCIETRRSTYGYSIFLGGNLVSLSAKKQPTVSRSSCES